MAANYHWRRCAATLFLLLLTAGTMAAQDRGDSSAAEETKRPKLTIDTTEHIFGEVKAGTQVSHTFTIKNAGTSLLEIRSVRPG